MLLFHREPRQQKVDERDLEQSRASSAGYSFPFLYWVSYGIETEERRLEASLSSLQQEAQKKEKELPAEEANNRG